MTAAGQCRALEEILQFRIFGECIQIDMIQTDGVFESKL